MGVKAPLSSIYISSPAAAASSAEALLYQAAGTKWFSDTFQPALAI